MLGEILMLFRFCPISPKFLGDDFNLIVKQLLVDVLAIEDVEVLMISNLSIHIQFLFFLS